MQGFLAVPRETRAEFLEHVTFASKQVEPTYPVPAMRADIAPAKTAITLQNKTQTKLR